MEEFIAMLRIMAEKLSGLETSVLAKLYEMEQRIYDLEQEQKAIAEKALYGD